MRCDSYAYEARQAGHVKWEAGRHWQVAMVDSDLIDPQRIGCRSKLEFDILEGELLLRARPPHRDAGCERWLDTADTRWQTVVRVRVKADGRRSTMIGAQQKSNIGL